jgi:hypothetical protein
VGPPGSDRSPSVGWGAVGGLLGTAGTAAFLMASHSAELAVVGVLASLHPAATVLREPFRLSQGLGLLVCGASVGLVAMADRTRGTCAAARVHQEEEQVKDPTHPSADGEVLEHVAPLLDSYVAGPRHSMGLMEMRSISRPGLEAEHVDTTGAALGGRAGTTRTYRRGCHGRAHAEGRRC